MGAMPSMAGCSCPSIFQLQAQRDAHTCKNMVGHALILNLANLANGLATECVPHTSAKKYPFLRSCSTSHPRCACELCNDQHYHYDTHTRLLHSAAIPLHCRYTTATLLQRPLLLHFCYTTATLSLHYCYTTYTLPCYTTPTLLQRPLLLHWHCTSPPLTSFSPVLLSCFHSCELSAH